MPMNSAQARIVDPILSQVAIGYENADLIGSALFPEVFVDANAGKVIEFDKSAFKLYASARAAGGNIAEVEFGYEGRPYALDPHGLSLKIPYETKREAENGPGIDLLTEHTEGVMSAIRLRLEYDQAQLAFNAANYDSDHKIVLAGDTKWSDADSSPIAQAETAIEAIRATTGRRPNTFAFGSVAWKAFRSHHEIRGSLASDKDKIVTPEFVAQLLRIKRVVVGDAVFANDANQFADVWGNAACLAYVPEASGAGRTRRQPSFGYTYVLRNHPFVEAPWYDKDTASWKAAVHMERAPQLTGVLAGYLFVSPN